MSGKRRFTEDDVRLVVETGISPSVRDANGLITSVQLKPLHEGSEHVAWTVNESLVIRLSMASLEDGPDGTRLDTLDLLKQESRLRNLLRDRMPHKRGLSASPNLSNIANFIPAVVAVGECSIASTTTPIAYMVEEQKFGMPVDATCEENIASQGKVTERTLQDLSALLLHLQDHCLVSEAHRIGIPLHECIGLPNLLQQTCQTLAELITATTGDESLRQTYLGYQKVMTWEACQAVCESAASILALSDSHLKELDRKDESDVILHADLKGEHVLLGADGSVLAVLDWTDAALGPPYIDIAGMSITVGALNAAKVGLMSGYGLRSCTKGLLFARCRCIKYLRDTEGPEWLLKVQAQRAFNSTI